MAGNDSIILSRGQPFRIGYSARTVSAIPPRAENCAVTIASRGAHAFTKSSRIAVRYCFVEGALIPIRSKIKLERLAFDAETVRHVIDIDPGKIGLACDWANRSEIVRFEMNPIIPARRGIWEGLEARLGR